MWGSAGFRRANARGRWSRGVQQRIARGSALLSLLTLVSATVVSSGGAVGPVGGMTRAGGGWGGGAGGGQAGGGGRREPGGVDGVRRGVREPVPDARDVERARHA